jgi:hypothetical protein
MVSTSYAYSHVIGISSGSGGGGGGGGGGGRGGGAAAVVRTVRERYHAGEFRSPEEAVYVVLFFVVFSHVCAFFLDQPGAALRCAMAWTLFCGGVPVQELTRANCCVERHGALA